MGAEEGWALAQLEASLKYHPWRVWPLTLPPEAGEGTAAGGQFDWGGRLPKRNGGAQRSPQAGWKSAGECIGTRGLDCEGDIPSRDESRAK